MLFPNGDPATTEAPPPNSLLVPLVSGRQGWGSPTTRHTGSSYTPELPPDNRTSGCNSTGLWGTAPVVGSPLLPATASQTAQYATGRSSDTFSGLLLPLRPDAAAARAASTATAAAAVVPSPVQHPNVSTPPQALHPQPQPQLRRARTSSLGSSVDDSDLRAHQLASVIHQQQVLISELEGGANDASRTADADLYLNPVLPLALLEAHALRRPPPGCGASAAAAGESPLSSGLPRGLGAAHPPPPGWLGAGQAATSLTSSPSPAPAPAASLPAPAPPTQLLTHAVAMIDETASVAAAAAAGGGGGAGGAKPLSRSSSSLLRHASVGNKRHSCSSAASHGLLASPPTSNQMLPQTRKPRSRPSATSILSHPSSTLENSFSHSAGSRPVTVAVKTTSGETLVLDDVESVEDVVSGISGLTGIPPSCQRLTRHGAPVHSRYPLDAYLRSPSEVLSVELEDMRDAVSTLSFATLSSHARIGGGGGGVGGGSSTVGRAASGSGVLSATGGAGTAAASAGAPPSATSATHPAAAHPSFSLSSRQGSDFPADPMLLPPLHSTPSAAAAAAPTPGAPPLGDALQESRLLKLGTADDFQLVLSQSGSCMSGPSQGGELSEQLPPRQRMGESPTVPCLHSLDVPEACGPADDDARGGAGKAKEDAGHEADVETLASPQHASFASRRADSVPPAPLIIPTSPLQLQLPLELQPVPGGGASGGGGGPSFGAGGGCGGQDMWPVPLPKPRGYTGLVKTWRGAKPSKTDMSKPTLAVAFPSLRAPLCVCAANGATHLRVFPLAKHGKEVSNYPFTECVASANRWLQVESVAVDAHLLFVGGGRVIRCVDTRNDKFPAVKADRWEVRDTPWCEVMAAGGGAFVCGERRGPLRLSNVEQPPGFDTSVVLEESLAEVGWASVSVCAPFIVAVDGNSKIVTWWATDTKNDATGAPVKAGARLGYNRKYTGSLQSAMLTDSILVTREVAPQENGQVIVWETDGWGRKLVELTVAPNSVVSVAGSKNDGIVAVLDEHRLTVWALAPETWSLASEGVDSGADSDAGGSRSPRSSRLIIDPPVHFEAPCPRGMGAAQDLVIADKTAILAVHVHGVVVWRPTLSSTPCVIA